MSSLSLHHQKLLAQAEAKAVAQKKAELTAKNKEAAKKYLLNIQLILARQSTR